MTQARRFAFVAAARPLVAGTIGGLGALALALLLAYWGGRLHQVDATFLVVVIGCASVSAAFVVVRLWRTARSAAAMLGHLALDDKGIRWHRLDGALGFDVAWTNVVRATVDARNATAVLFQREGGPVLVGVLSGHGVPSGFVVPERFTELVALIGSKVPTGPHQGTRSVAAGRSALLLGLITCSVAAGLYAANLAIGAWLHWRRLLLPMPAFIAAVGLLTLVAGARLRWGSGPLVSPMYAPGYRASVLRFLAVATVANFVLVAIMNALAR